MSAPLAANRRRRILFLIDNCVSTGGAERSAVALASHLPADRFETWLCATRSSDELATQALAAAGVRHLTLQRTAKWDVHRLRRLVGLLRAQRFDLLHSHMFGSNLWGSLLGTAFRIPAIVVQEHGWSFEGAARAWVDGHVIGRLADRFVAVSRADGDRMVSVEGIAPDKVVVIPNAYIPSATASDTDVRRELGLGPDTPLIAIAAVLRPEKRLDLLLRAHARVLAALPAARLVIAGEGPCRETLEHEAGSLGITGAVHFLGRRSDVDSILRAADVAALSSDREGSPLLMFECMANGTPLVATAVGGIPEVIDPGRTGILVPRRDPDALAGALLRLLTHPDERAALAGAARAQLPAHTLPVAVDRFVALYDTLLAR